MKSLLCNEIKLTALKCHSLLLLSDLQNGVSFLTSWLLPMTRGCRGGFLSVKRFRHFPGNFESGPGCAGLGTRNQCCVCLLYTSDAADEVDVV